jgi:hypothetical protein
LKNKLIAAAVIVLLVLSVVATGLAAVSDVSSDRPGAASTALAGSAGDAESDGENVAVQSFKWVCPFH